MRGVGRSGGDDRESVAAIPTDGFPRALTRQERGVLDFILRQTWDGVEVVRAMLRETRVTDTCRCGCGSVGLSVVPPTTDLCVPSPVPAEAVARIDGQVVGVLLFIDDGGGYLEFTWFCDEDLRPERLPEPDELETAEWREVEPGSGARTLVNFDS